MTMLDVAALKIPKFNHILLHSHVGTGQGQSL